MGICGCIMTYQFRAALRAEHHLLIRNSPRFTQCLWRFFFGIIFYRVSVDSMLNLSRLVKKNLDSLSCIFQFKWVTLTPTLTPTLCSVVQPCELLLHNTATCKIDSRVTDCNRLVFCFLGPYGNAGGKRGSDEPIRIRSPKNGYGRIQWLSVAVKFFKNRERQ